MDEQIPIDQKFITASKILLAAFAVRIVSSIFQGIQYLMSFGLAFTLVEFLNIIFSSVTLLLVMFFVVYFTRRGHNWVKMILLLIIIIEIYWRFYNHAIFELDLISWWAYLLSSTLILIATVVLFVPSLQKR
jgi:hypothetical protein